MSKLALPPACIHGEGRKRGALGPRALAGLAHYSRKQPEEQSSPNRRKLRFPELLVPQQSPVITSAVDPVSGAERGRLVSTFTEKTSQGGRQAVNGERNAKVSAIKRAGRGMFGIPPNMECTCRLWMGRGKGSDHRANDPLTPACRDFPGFSTGILTCQELLGRRPISTVVTLELEAGRPEIQTHIL